MIPVISNKKDFSSDAIGRLKTFADNECVVREVANGELVASFTYPLNGVHAEHVKELNYVLIKPNARDEAHSFEIISADRDYIRGVITVKAVSHTTVSQNDFVDELHVVGMNAQQAMRAIEENLVLSNGLRYRSDMTDKLATLEPFIRKSAISCIFDSEQSIVSAFGGELKRNFNELTLMGRRGIDNAAVIRYGKHLNGFTLDTDFTDTVTVVVPFYMHKEKKVAEEPQPDIEYSETNSSTQKNGDTVTTTTVTIRKRNNFEVGRTTTISVKTKISKQRYKTQTTRTIRYEDGRQRVTTSVAYSDANSYNSVSNITVDPKSPKTHKKKDEPIAVYGDVVYSSLAEHYPRYFVRLVDFSDYDDVVDVDSLNARARMYFSDNDNVDKPKINIKVNMLLSPRHRTPLKYLEDVGLFDTVTVYVKKYNVNVLLKVTEMEYDFFNERIKKITLGDSKNSFVDAVVNVAKAEVKKNNRVVVDTFDKFIKNEVKHFSNIIDKQTEDVKRNIEASIANNKILIEHNKSEFSKKLDQEIQKANEQAAQTADDKINKIIVQNKNFNLLSLYNEVIPAEMSNFETQKHEVFMSPNYKDGYRLKITLMGKSESKHGVAITIRITFETESGVKISKTIPNVQYLLKQVKTGTANGLYTHTFSDTIYISNAETGGKKISFLQVSFIKGNATPKIYVDKFDISSIVDADFLIDGFVTARHIRADQVEATHIKSGSITAEKLLVDTAFVEKLSTNDLLAKKITASNAFVSSFRAVKIASEQITTETLRGKTIIGSTIVGATIQGDSRISLGGEGYLQGIYNGLQINAPDKTNSRSGIGVQIHGLGWDSGYPEGMFIYRDNDFNSQGTHENSTTYLLTVAGYVKAAGFGAIAYYDNNISSDKEHGGGELRFWNNDTPRPGLLLNGGYGSNNDIFYTFNGTAYPLWPLVSGNTSDVKLKRNIKDSSNSALELINKMRFREFDWADDNPYGRCKPHTSIGLIAQEVQQIDHTLIIDGKYLSLDTLRLSQIALKAAKELHVEIQELRKEVKEWKKKNNN